ncbi:class I SAM-dependent methyltransferase [Inmirania thermothiophila]|uniref:Methyltransferase family protein n=1 Tax=Inmirania thermothiophila TaxID=1750597 RepID=A0A3N1Y702_9GAMM|nr:class I SAM-dependent methyltransferase [Inmirania thermothiophila]ROR34301.1 methyltransferase family protein [Inmirania thermothiophila]
MERHRHWEQVYAERGPDRVSWYRPRLETSLGLIARAALPPEAPIVDVGGGASTLVDALLAEGRRDLTVVDLSPRALATARARLGEAGRAVCWVCADLLRWPLRRGFALWHDRAVLHFLTDEAERARYREVLAQAVVPGGWAVIATFAHDGPERCSGLPVRRHAPEEIAALAGPEWSLEAAERELHLTPAGAAQPFAYALLRRRR